MHALGLKNYFLNTTETGFEYDPHSQPVDVPYVFVAPLDTIKCTQYVTTDSAERPVSDTRNQPW